MNDRRDRCRVYIIQAGHDGPIKIGIAKNVKSRLASLQTGNPHELRVVLDVDFPSTGAARNVERYAHKAFAKYRVKGEWFTCSAEEVVAWLRETEARLIGERAISVAVPVLQALRPEALGGDALAVSKVLVARLYFGISHSHNWARLRADWKQIEDADDGRKGLAYAIAQSFLLRWPKSAAA